MEKISGLPRLPQLPARDVPVRLREAVGHVPADGAEVPALEDERVEEAEPEEELLELLRPEARLKPEETRTAGL